MIEYCNALINHNPIVSINPEKPKSSTMQNIAINIMAVNKLNL